MVLKTYSDIGATTPASEFNVGDTIYLNGNILTSANTTSTTVKIEVFNSSNVLQTTPLNTTYNFTANTDVTITTINSSVVESFSTVGYTAGEFYLKLTVSGTGVDTTYDYEWFKLSSVTPPVISSQQLNDYAITSTEQTIASCSVTNMTANDEIYLEINSNAWKMSTTDNIAYTKTLYGYEIGLCSAVTVKFVAKNASGADEENASSTLTVSKATIDTQTKIADILITLRDYLRANLTDPKSTTRTNSQWIYTSSPDLQTVQYPTITLYNSGMRAEPMGMSSLIEKNTINVLISVYSKSTKECDELSDNIIYWLKANRQVLVNDGLFNYIRANTFDDKSDLDNKIRIKRIEVQYDYISV